MNTLPGDTDLAAGLNQRDIDRAYDGYGGRSPAGDPEKLERELERAERRRADEIDRELDHKTPTSAAAVWKFYDAPKQLRALSTNGGDEDWLVELPPGWEENGTPYWIEAMDSCREPKSYPHPTKLGWKVIIGAA